MLAATLMTACLAVAAGLLLGYAAIRLAPRDEELVERIDALLPQTQCGQCTFPGCRPYALAIANGDADINQCPPGGESTVRALAELLGREPKPVDETFGRTDRSRSVAWIDEDLCIGCTLCIQACPVDAIVGAGRRMHTVIAEHCTGCELCLPPCPVDCIEMRTVAKDGGASRLARRVRVRTAA